MLLQYRCCLVKFQLQTHITNYSCVDVSITMSTILEIFHYFYIVFFMLFHDIEGI